MPVSSKRVASTKLCPIEANDREAQNYYRHETTRRCEYDINILGLHVVDLSLHIVLFYVCILHAVSCFNVVCKRFVAVLQMQCMYRPVIPSFSFRIFHIEISTVLESRACS